MITPKILEDINEKLVQLLDNGPQKTQQELKSAVNQLLQGAFSRVNLVTREDFDAQQAVLERTRMLVESLEKRLATLENSFEKQSN